MRAPTFFQQCRDQQWYIHQLQALQAGYSAQICDFKERLANQLSKAGGYSIATGRHGFGMMPGGGNNISMAYGVSLPSGLASSAPISAFAGSNSSGMIPHQDRPGTASPKSSAKGPSLACASSLHHGYGRLKRTRAKAAEAADTRLLSSMGASQPGYAEIILNRIIVIAYFI